MWKGGGGEKEKGKIERLVGALGLVPQTLLAPLATDKIVI